jgi:RNA polymerase-interacting CarD/CdnL/TRCF family regulator
VRVRLAVGGVVVYGTHGVGRIAARAKDAEGTETVVVELAEGLTVTLPLPRAREQLRAIASKTDVDAVRRTLREDRRLSFDPWLSRRRQAIEKLTSGTIVDLAELVSDCAQRERLRLANRGSSQLPSAEREISRKARKLLAGEIALALSLEPDAADEWIEEQLARP